MAIAGPANEVDSDPTMWLGMNPKTVHSEALSKALSKGLSKALQGGK